MFKSLPDEQQSESPDDLAALSDMIKQELIDKQFSGAVQQIKV
jgi:hypothetical protein